MQNGIPTLLLGATLLLACGPDGDQPAQDDLRDTAVVAADTADAAVFVDRPPASAQFVFVGTDATALPGDRENAVFVPFSTFSVERDGIPNEFPPADSMAELLRGAGVRGGPVVLVGEPIPVGRAFAAFDYLGLAARAAILDGGPAALGPARAPTGATEPVDGESDFEVKRRVNVVVSASWVHDMLDDTTVAILDARPPAEFSGETPGGGIERPGHIPGARNVFWETLIVSTNNPRLKDDAELRRIFEEAGVGPDDTVVAYCRTGGQAGFLYAVARHLGYSVRLYDGSFFDWSRTDYPVERGSTSTGSASSSP